MTELARLLVVGGRRAASRCSARTRPARRSASASTSSAYDVAITIEPDGTLRIARVDHLRLRRRPAPRHLPRPRATRALRQGPRPPVPHRRRERHRRRGRTRAQCSTTTNGPYLHLRIGDPNTTDHRRAPLPDRLHGAGRALTFADHDELYWDAIGNQWPVPIDNAHGRRSRRRSRSHAVACFTGPQGSSLSRATARASCAGRRDVRARRTSRRLGPDRRGRDAEGHDPAAAAADPRAPPDARERVLGHAAHRPASPAGSRCSASRSSSCSRRGAGRDRRYTGSAVDAAMGNTSGEEEPIADPPPRDRPGGVHPARRHPARPGRHAHRRAGEPARRDRVDRRSRRARLAHDHRARSREALTAIPTTSSPRRRARARARRSPTSSCSCTSSSTTATR